MTAPEDPSEADEPKRGRCAKAFDHPDGIVSAQDFFNYSSIAFSTGYLEAIEATSDPKQAAEFAEGAALFAKDATDPRAKKMVAACEEAARAKFSEIGAPPTRNFLAGSKIHKRTGHDVDPNDDRPTIRLVPGEIEELVDEAEAALIEANRSIYQRDGRIVSIGSASAIAADETKFTVQRIFEPAHMLCRKTSRQQRDSKSTTRGPRATSSSIRQCQS
jgi:hypothetical protein